MAYDFSSFKQKILGVEDWLKKELSSVRTGRASLQILDNVSVDAYGSKMALREVASLGVEDPKTIRISPWDKTQSKSIEKALIVANLGVSVVVDDKGLRVIFPELTSERRVSMVKIAKEKLEEARVSLRRERDEIKNDIEKKEKEGGMGEDEKFRLKEEVQKLIDEANEKLDKQFTNKEAEILG